MTTTEERRQLFVALRALYCKAFPGILVLPRKRPLCYRMYNMLPMAIDVWLSWGEMNECYWKIDLWNVHSHNWANPWMMKMVNGRLKYTQRSSNRFKGSPLCKRSIFSVTLRIFPWGSQDRILLLNPVENGSGCKIAALQFVLAPHHYCLDIPQEG